MGKKNDEQRNRICLDCAKMLHSTYDYERGKCVEDGHEIDCVNNHGWCRHFSAPDWRKPHIENSEGYDSVNSIGDIQFDGPAHVGNLGI